MVQRQEQKLQIELKNIKYFAAMSEETSCFQATVFVEGKKAGMAENSGHGGPTSIDPFTLQKQIDEFAATLPKETLDLGDGKTFESAQTAESLINKLLHRYLGEKELRKRLSKRLVFTKKNASGIYQTKTLTAAEMQKQMSNPKLYEVNQIDKLLNTLPFDEALAIYIANGA